MEMKWTGARYSCITGDPIIQMMRKKWNILRSLRSKLLDWLKRVGKKMSVKRAT
jgi:hypothetical protein